jgi:alkane 1-monooxygenase
MWVPDPGGCLALTDRYLARAHPARWQRDLHNPLTMTSRTDFAPASPVLPNGGAALDPAWRDPKRYAWLLGLLVPVLPAAGWLFVHLTGLGLFWFAGPIVVFGVIPLLDFLVGADAKNPPDAVIAALEEDRYYRACTYAYVPIQYATLVLACWCWAHGGLSIVAKLGLALTVGCVSGIAINTAHELGHKRESVERWLSKIALAQSGYGHFYVEHNRGHHVRVATHEDPASSRYGESFYAFWPRTVAGSFASSCEIERTRLTRNGGSFWTWKNDVLNAWAMTIVLFGALVLAFGTSIAPYLLLQAFIGFTLLEIVNYLEHYGLARRRGADGRYERCLPEHSWNSNHVVSNVFLYHLQRHSDHHAHPMRRFQALRSFDGAPNLPSGYATMILVALVPPLWRRMMNPRVAAHYDGDLSRANLTRREQVAADAAQTASGEGAVAATEGEGASRKYRCPGCGYVYDERAGHPREGFVAGTRWSSVPSNWHCPECGVRDKVDFVAVEG